nr:hypothetical protein [Tanacetum cinerariifolium]
MAQWKKYCSSEEHGISVMRKTVEHEHMAWQTDYCIMKEGMPILRGWKSVPGMNSSEREMERGYYSAFTCFENDENADGGKKDDMGACIEKLDKVRWAA